MMNPANCRKPQTLYLIPLLALIHCSSPANDMVTVNQVALTQAKAISQFIKNFSVYIIQYSENAEDDTKIRCQDFPQKIHENPQILPTPIVEIPWTNANSEVQVTLQLEANLSTFILVRGSAEQVPSKWPYIASGCIDDQLFETDTLPMVEVVVKPTTGAPCQIEEECEPGLKCLNLSSSTTKIPNYCGQLKCKTDQECPPSTRCIKSAEDGICMVRCESSADCVPPTDPKQPKQECAGRQSPDLKTCAKVCTYSAWNTETKCSQ